MSSGYVSGINDLQMVPSLCGAGCCTCGSSPTSQTPRSNLASSTYVVSRYLSWNPPVIWPDCSGDGFPGMTEQSGHLAVAMEVSVTAVV